MMRVVPSTRRMGYYDHTPSQQTQGDEPFFPVNKTVIFESDARPGEHLLCILETKAMLGDVVPFLRLVPFVFHFRFVVDCNSFCNYRQALYSSSRWGVSSRDKARANWDD